MQRLHLKALFDGYLRIITEYESQVEIYDFNGVVWKPYILPSIPPSFNSSRIHKTLKRKAETYVLYAEIYAVTVLQPHTSED
jgi:hypothetical protein